MGLFDALGGVLGGIIGGNAGAGARGEANNDMNTANQIIQEIQAAPDISAPVILQKYQQAGILTPQMQQTINASLPSNITTNPAFKQAQMQALQQMQQRANTGLTQGDRAALNQAQLGAQRDTQSKLAQIQQQMQQQGLADSGSSLAAKLSAAQSGANQESNNADQVAQMSQQAREQALGNLGQFANQSQNQDFGQQLAQQQAQQQMQRFNIQNQLGVQSANTNAANQAQASNLANAQNASNQNVAGQNNESYNQLQRQMGQWGANANLATTKANSERGLGSWNQAQGEAQADAGQKLGQGLGSALGTAVSFLNQGGPVNYKQGGEVGGHAPVNGDSPANDIVHAMLSPGELVIPRTLAQSKFGKHILKIIEAHKNLKDHVNGDDNA